MPRDPNPYPSISSKVTLPKKAYGKKSDPRTTAEIVEYIEESTKPWGGPVGFGKELKKEFESAKKGSHQRIRILEMMMEWLKLANDLRQRDGVIDEMGNDELAKELHELLGYAEPDRETTVDFVNDG